MGSTALTLATIFCRKRLITASSARLAEESNRPYSARVSASRLVGSLDESASAQQTFTSLRVSATTWPLGATNSRCKAFTCQGTLVPLVFEGKLTTDARFVTGVWAGVAIDDIAATISAVPSGSLRISETPA